MPAMHVLTASLSSSTEEIGWITIFMGLFVIAGCLWTIRSALRPGGGYYGRVGLRHRRMVAITRARPVQFWALTVVWCLATVGGVAITIQGCIKVFLWTTR